jgi:hypothetical protein
LKFVRGDQADLFGAVPTADSSPADVNSADPVGALGELIQMGDAPACNTCGSLNGAQRDVLQLYDVWEHKRMLIAAAPKRER